jgi:hypothetical protein
MGHNCFQSFTKESFPSNKYENFDAGLGSNFSILQSFSQKNCENSNIYLFCIFIYFLQFLKVFLSKKINSNNFE